MSSLERPRRILAIECSTPAASVAMRSRSGDLLERPVATGDRRRDHLPPAIDALLVESGCARHDLDGIAISEGPGGFTGLRISVALAKGIAEALGIPTLGVASAAVAAASTLADEDPRPALVVLATKRGTAWVEAIDLDAATGRRVSGGGRIVEASSAFECPGDAVVLADAKQDSGIVAMLAVGGREVREPRVSAGSLLRLAERTPFETGWGDPDRLAVRYPRVPEAVAKWNAGAR